MDRSWLRRGCSRSSRVEGTHAGSGSHVNRSASRSRPVTGRPRAIVRVVVGLVRSLAVLLLLTGVLLVALVAVVDLAASAAPATPAAPSGAEAAAPAAGPLARRLPLPSGAAGAEDQVLAESFKALEVLRQIDRSPLADLRTATGAPTTGAATIPLSGAQLPGRQGPDVPGPPRPPWRLALLPQGPRLDHRQRRGPADGDAGGGGAPGRDLILAGPSAAVAASPTLPPPRAQEPLAALWAPTGLDRIAQLPGGDQALVYAFLNRWVGGAGLGVPFPNLGGFVALSLHDWVIQNVIASQPTTLPDTVTSAVLVGVLPYVMEASHFFWNLVFVVYGRRPAFPHLDPHALAANGLLLVLSEGPGKDWLRHREGWPRLPAPVGVRYGRPVWASPADYSWNLGYDMAVHFAAGAGALGALDYWYRVRLFRDSAERSHRLRGTMPLFPGSLRDIAAI